MVMTIGEAASRAGVTAKTIRFYEGTGLVQPAARGENGYRAYGEKEVRTLKFISRARALGFSLKAIAGLLALYRDPSRASQDVKTMAAAQIAEVDRRIAELTVIRTALREVVERCHGDDRPDCPIFDELARPLH